jgi:hypothetical protein
MQFRVLQVKLDKSASPFRRALQYAFYDWTRDMPPRRRIVATFGLLVQAAVLSGLLIAIGHHRIAIPLGVLFLIGLALLNGALTSEFVRKMQLESDQIAAQQIQQTLLAQNPEPLIGYELQTFYKPFRDVGGDYFDVIALPHNRTLFAVADVSGKGIPAALLAANIQALVRSIAGVDADPLTMARQINKHLSRYTPSDHFATALFIVLSRDSGELLYVNAGHNAPIVSCSGVTTFLEATGCGLLQSPKRRIGLHQFESRVPRFMAAPDDFRFRFAPRFLLDQPDALVQRQVSPHYGHATGMAYIHSDGVGVLFCSALLPFHQKLHAGDDALVASQSFPAFLQGNSGGVFINLDGHRRPLCGRVTGPGK